MSKQPVKKVEMHPETPESEPEAPEAPPETVDAMPESSPEPVQAEPEAEDVTGGYRRPVEPESWLDEPFAQWVEETPADEAIRLARERGTPPVPDSVPLWPNHETGGDGPVFARGPSGYPPVAFQDHPGRDASGDDAQGMAYHRMAELV
jgi:hypothetical protein